MAKFDEETLRKLHDCKEVAIRTTKHPGSAVTIWVVVSSTDVFIRSVRGTKGRWYRDLATGGPATLEFDGEQLAVEAAPATATLVQSNVPARNSSRNIGRAPMPHRLCAKTSWRLRYGWTQPGSTGT
jgi:hypothetical protein